MSSWFTIINLILLSSPLFLQVRSRPDSKRRYSVPTVPFLPPPPPPFPFDDNTVYGSNDDSWIESAITTTTTIKPLKASKYRANEQQIEQFTRLIIERLNLKEPPNITDGTGFPSSIVKQLEQQTKEQQHIHHNAELNSYQQQKHRDEIQATTERAILPGDFIPHHTCQRQVAAVRMNRKHENYNHIDCFRFIKSSSESSKSLPTNQMIKQLRIYVKKNYFFFNNDQQDVFTPNMFQIYQVYRPTSNDTSHYPFNDLTGTIRVTLNQVKQLSDNWFELTVDPNNQQISIQQLYQQFIMPWYGLAIDRELQPSWSSYKRHYSKKHLENFLRSDDDEDDNNKETQQQQHPYMLVEYGDKIPSTSSGGRGTRAVPARPARPCDPKSPCCRRSLTIDLDQGNNALNFVIYPRQLDIGECIGQCGTSGSSLKHTDVKNAQHKNEQSAGYNLFLLHANGMHKNATTQNNKSDQQSTQCCSYSRTGGLELMYSTTNGGPIIRKFIPNMVVEEFPPSIRTQSTLVHTSIGKSVFLRCSAIVPYDTKLYWRRMDNNTISKFRQQQNIHGDVTQISLHIKDIEKHDFGFYACFAESIAGQSHIVIELKEHRRLTTNPTLQTTEKDEVSTARIQILKRNKIADQTTIMSIKTNSASSSCFTCFYLSFIFIQIIFYNLT